MMRIPEGWLAAWITAWTRVNDPLRYHDIDDYLEALLLAAGKQFPTSTQAEIKQGVLAAARAAGAAAPVRKNYLAEKEQLKW